jgi:hypothetical protein
MFSCHKPEKGRGIMKQLLSTFDAVIRSRCITRLSFLTVTVLSTFILLAQSPPPPETITIPFPETTTTSFPGFNSCNFIGPSIYVPGPKGADSSFGEGQFVNYFGENVYVINGSNPSCSTTGYVRFVATKARPGTRFPSAFTMDIINVGAQPDVIYGVFLDDSPFGMNISPRSIPAGGRITISGQGSHIWLIGLASFTHAHNYSFPSMLAIASLTITQPPPEKPEFQVRAANITSAANSETATVKADQVNGTIPLGARFSLSLERVATPPTAVMASFQLGPASLTNAQTDPTLYPSSALLQFNGQDSATVKTFQAVHLGSQNVVITPDDSSISRVTVTVNVLAPSGLGTTHRTVTDGGASYNLDTKIVEWADKRGIPPQLIKGIMDRESASLFTPKEWRYEPLTTDWDNFAPPCPTLGLGADVCHNERARARYVPYRMEYDASHPRGSLLVDSEDVHPRSVFYSDRKNGVHFADSQQLVSVYDIVSENESWQNWIKILGNQKKKALLTSSQLQSTLSWPANTTLASSYGMMQVLFEESFDSYGYAGIQGQRRPYYLFDLPANVAAGAGSIPVGSGVYVFKYRWENGFNDTNDFAPVYDNPAKLDDDYQNGLMGYNGDFCLTITLQKQCYGPDTMNRIKKYPPVAATNIFP